MTILLLFQQNNNINYYSQTAFRVSHTVLGDFLYLFFCTEDNSERFMF